MNAGLLAAQILGAFDEEVADALHSRREHTEAEVLQSTEDLI